MRVSLLFSLRLRTAVILTQRPPGQQDKAPHKSPYGDVSDAALLLFWYNIRAGTITHGLTQHQPELNYGISSK
jgi:hypothetical protein